MGLGFEAGIVGRHCITLDNYFTMNSMLLCMITFHLTSILSYPADVSILGMSDDFADF